MTRGRKVLNPSLSGFAWQIAKGKTYAFISSSSRSKGQTARASKTLGPPPSPLFGPLPSLKHRIEEVYVDLVDTLRAAFRSCNVLSSCSVKRCPLHRDPRTMAKKTSSLCSRVLGDLSLSHNESVCLHAQMRNEQFHGSITLGQTETLKHSKPFLYQHPPGWTPHVASSAPPSPSCDRSHYIEP